MFYPDAAGAKAPCFNLPMAARLQPRPLKTYNLSALNSAVFKNKSKQIKSYCNAACCLIHAS
jgi:hypothetical protein